MAKEVRLIDENGHQVGLVSTLEALKRARDAGLDLVEIAPSNRPPVCKIMDYGKFIYDAAKKVRESKKKQVSNYLKTIKIRLNIGESDFNVKSGRIKEFLEDGDKVKIMILFRGREIIYKQRGFELLERIHDLVKDYGRMERKPKLEGRNIIAIIAPISKKG